MRHAAHGVLAIALALAGCASLPQRSPAHERADELNRTGLSHLRAGDAERARVAFEQSVRIAQSIEDEAGIARGWYNLSVAYQRLGRTADADAALDAVLQDDRAYPRNQLVEIGLRKAVLATSRDDVDGASRALERVLPLCAGDCPSAAAIANLQARIALRRARPDEAMAHLAVAHERYRRQPVEQANTLRLRAAALIALERLAEARLAAEAALAIDKRQGAGEKIYQDLMLLARVAAGPSERRGFLMRAGDIARALGDQEGLRRVESLLGQDASTPPLLPRGAP
jgi:tetratricopeptide (TPR) repeat protein